MHYYTSHDPREDPTERGLPDACVVVQTIGADGESIHETVVAGLISGINGSLLIRGPVRDVVQDETGDWWDYQRQITKVPLAQIWQLHSLPFGYETWIQTLDNVSDVQDLACMDWEWEDEGPSTGAGEN
jgi:hypothetical protein